MKTKIQNPILAPNAFDTFVNNGTMKSEDFYKAQIEASQNKDLTQAIDNLMGTLDWLSGAVYVHMCVWEGLNKAWEYSLTSRENAKDELRKIVRILTLTKEGSEYVKEVPEFAEILAEVKRILKLKK